ncbi:phosphotransferase [Allofrancisella guangzhouensis]|uniref:AarF/UbiB family protein n=1 Tax=Allofrancisella guangzhouensis TaxID=594679 RepID=UPI0019075811|nr:AarF/UbiB family protein [Allofrancisella guangzhouensis]MBK2044777.1 phosphotransferase [Allofrancisella guangzhouensis]MBK2046379.1 phosphotransferase [Allofrancisella guangzhouensis]
MPNIPLHTYKENINDLVLTYTKKFIIGHKKRALNLSIGIQNASTLNELIMILMNERNLLLGKGCVNQFTIKEGYWTSDYAKTIKRTDIKGKHDYYKLIENSLEYIRKGEEVSNNSMIGISKLMNKSKFDRNTIYPSKFNQNQSVNYGNRFSISPYSEVNDLYEIISNVWSQENKEKATVSIKERYEAEKIGDLFYPSGYPNGEIDQKDYLNVEVERMELLLKDEKYTKILKNKEGLLRQIGLPVNLLQMLMLIAQNNNINRQNLEKLIQERDKESLKTFNNAIESLNKELLPLLDILKSQLGNLGEFFYRVLTDYFLTLNDHEKLWVSANITRSPELYRENVNIQKEFPICLMRTGGPYYHKICQLIAFAGRGRNNEALQMFESALNGLSPLHDDYLFEIKQKIENDGKINIKDIKFIKTLGKASIGVAFLAKCNKGIFVIKVIRPDLSSRCARDRFIFITIANNNKLTVLPSIDPIMKSIDEELSFAEEIRNMQLGAVYRQYKSLTNGPSINICEVIETDEGEEAPYLMQSVAPGKTVSEWIKEKYFEPELLYRLFDLSYTWFTEAIPGKGACHCDLHAGNMLYDNKNKVISVIDFGNFTKFKGAEKSAILRMMLSTVTGDWEEFLKNFKELLPNKVNLPSQLYNRAYKSCYESKLGEISQVQAIQEILNKAVSLNVSVPEPIIKFARTATMLEGAISAVIQNSNSHAYDDYSFECAIGRAIGNILQESKMKLIYLAGLGNCWRVAVPKEFQPPKNYTDPDN